MMDELRATRRFPCSARFVGASATTLSGEVRDLSPTGLCLATSTPVAKGKQLHLEFELPSGPVEAVGEVRWSRPGGDGLLELGIRFVRISAASQQTIEEGTQEKPAPSRWTHQVRLALSFC